MCLVINVLFDVVYFKVVDILIFKNLVIILSIFKGIDELYKEVIKEEVEEFLDELFIELSNNYSVEKVLKLNWKCIGFVMKILDGMLVDDKINMFEYIDGYCE